MSEKRNRRAALVAAALGLLCVASSGPQAIARPDALVISGAVLVRTANVGSNVATAAVLPDPQSPLITPLPSCYDLSWTLPVGVAGSYVNRSNDAGATWLRIATVPAPASTYRDCEPGNNASYNVTTYVSGWESEHPGTPGGDATPPVVTTPPPLNPPITWSTPRAIPGIASTSQASDGNFYATTTGGGLFRISPTGVATQIPADLPLGIHGSVLAADGNIYATTTTGTFLKVSLTGQVTTLRTGMGNLLGIVQGRDGFFYVINSTQGGIQRYSAAGSATMTATGITSPYGIVEDTAGNFYVTSYSSGSLWKVIKTTGVATRVATGLGTSAAGVTIAKNGYLYVTEYTSGRVHKVNTAGVATIVATLARPWGIMQGRDGYFYITDPVNGLFIRQSLA